MAAKTQTAPTTSMFGQVEQRPKREGNFTGRTVDADKLKYLTEMFTNFAAFATEHEMVDGQQLPVTDLRGYKPASLAVTGNALLAQQDNPGFYLVATEHEELEGGKKGQPTKLVIRVGQRPKRNRTKKDAE